MTIRFDHCVIHVSNWADSNAWYHDVLNAQIIPNGEGVVYRFGRTQLNLHGPGLTPTPLARCPVVPGNSDLCFEYEGPIHNAVRPLHRCGVDIELGPVARFGARGEGMSVYFRDPDGSLLEFISYQET